MSSATQQLAAKIMSQDLRASRGNTDRMFAVMMLLQFVTCVIVALIVSPRSWHGSTSTIHFHLWIAMGLGALLASLPILMTIFHPGTLLTRMVIGVSQMLFSSLLIHLCGGRIEAHFHIFVSLACLAFYRDWRVLLLGTIITTLDHFVRGVLWPQSVFGVLIASPWRSIEHTIWILLEDMFLVVACREKLKNTMRASRREAELQILKLNFERQVQAKTNELVKACENTQSALNEISALRYALDQHALLSITDSSGKIIDANAGFCRVSGYTQHELLGKDHRILNSGYHSREFWINMWRTVARGRPWRDEVCNKAKDGSLYWVDSTIIPQIGTNGKPERYVSLRFDITDKKLAEESLRNANERYQLLAAAVERSPDCTVVTNLNGIVRFCNPAARELDAMFGHHIENGTCALLFAQDRVDASIVKRLVETVRAGQVFQEQLECRYDAGGTLLEFDDRCSIHPTKMLNVTASPLVNDDGVIDGILIAKRDVTDEVIRQRTLEEITTAMDAATDCVFIMDAESMRFVYVNQGALKHVGYTREEMREMTTLDINPTLDEASFTKLTAPLLRSPGTAINFRSEHQHRDGHRIPVEISLQLIPQLGRSGRFLAIVRDITEQLQSERALQDAKDQAESSSRSKSEFLANMSHEIRTPMTAILGFADLLDSDGDFAKDPALAANAIQTIRSNANHLITIINDILDMSKIEAGKMSVEHIDLSPTKLIDEVLSLMQPRAFGKGIELHLEYETRMPTRINSDPTRFRQILLNLLGNSVKFTEVGKVTLRVSLLSESELLQIRVVDTGIGMSQEQCESIGLFNAFSQADGSTSRKFGGTGLGLRISNSLARMLGGKIQVDSQLGVGSTFTLTLATGSLAGVDLFDPGKSSLFGEATPTVARPEVSTGTRAKRLEGLRILLAEDGPDNQRLISFHLRKAGAEVVIAENGQVAVDMIEADENRFDLVFMDMQMPELDGYAAAIRLRSWGYTRPIIALTAHAMSGDRQKCLDAGCDNYTTKPIHRQSLIELAEQYGRPHLAPA